MDRARYSRIAHGDLPLWNPIALEPLVRLAERGLEGRGPRAARVLDVGCGRAGLLIALLERFSESEIASAIGVDPLADTADLVKAAKQPDAKARRLELRAEAFDADRFEPGSFALVVCLGALHAVGGLRGAFESLGPLVEPGGHLLLAEGYWKREPDPAYLAALGGAQRSDLGTRAETLSLITGLGWELRDEHVASLPEWDHYEGSYAANMARHLQQNPKDPDAEAMRERSTAWNAAYRAYGRSTLGFTAYLCAREL